MNAMTKRLWNALHWARASRKSYESSGEWQAAEEVESRLEALNEIIGKGHKCDICYKKFKDEDAVAEHLIFQDEIDGLRHDTNNGEPFWFYKTCRTITNKASKGFAIAMAVAL